MWWLYPGEYVSVYIDFFCPQRPVLHSAKVQGSRGQYEANIILDAGCNAYGQLENGQRMMFDYSQGIWIESVI